MTKTVVEILKEAKSLIDTPEKWTKETYARSTSGGVISEHEDGAVCFCSLGAFFRVAKSADVVYMDSGWDILIKAVKLIKPTAYSVATFNDNHTHAEVMAMWDKAIELAAADET